MQARGPPTIATVRIPIDPEVAPVPLFRFLAVLFAKTFSKIFGFATIAFFGRVPSRDDDKVAVVGVLSLTWLVVLAAVVVPDLAELTVPGLSEDDETIRWLGVAGAVAIPALNGALISRMHNQPDGTGALVRNVVRGYPYTAVIGGVVVALVVTVPIVRGSRILRRIDLEHIAVMVPDEVYDEVIERIHDAVTGIGLEAEITRPPAAIRRMFQALAWAEGSIFRREHAARKIRSVQGEIEGEPFEVVLHATDITIIGRRRESSRIAAALAEHLDHPGLYVSWDDEAQHVEDRIRDARGRVADDQPVERGEIEELREALRGLELSLEEWSAIHRRLCRLEIEHLERQVDATDRGSDVRRDDGALPAAPVR